MLRPLRGLGRPDRRDARAAAVGLVADNGQVLCLACSRAQAGEAAVVSAPDSTSREERLRLRRTALIEYEIDRAPEAPNRTIALACHTSSATVAAVRGDLDASGAAPADIDARSVA